ncbi:hypothetical protein BDZ91DRAFT_737780 [Kalaharituber pfeilii]|nr:hypothetical protein BDZ91DRAFT_737780 [Kalaharituber pfeilii]
MTEPVVDSFGNAKFTEDFRSDNNYQPDSEVPHSQSTLKKKTSAKRGGKSSRPGSVAGSEGQNPNSALYTPIPTHNNPTEALAARFQAWRRLLKDYIGYFREVQSTNEARAKSLLKLSQSIDNQFQASDAFMKTGGILETNAALRDMHKEGYLVAENAKSIETEIINHLVGLRGDLNLKIKEIRALSGDFKNNVDKEKEATKKAILQLTEAIQNMEGDPQSTIGKSEPYIVRLQVEKQIRRQLSEENYLHKAYLNLESSGRELEKIVVGEVQKAFATYSQIIRREGQQLLSAVDKIDATIKDFPQDKEWSDFVSRDANIVDPSVPLRNFEDIEYPGLHHPLTSVVRAGELERRTKYLKSYASGWYILSSTHLHEFKSPDRVNDLTPMMSLYLPDCTLGSHSDPAAISHKFVLKGRQTGPMHTRHSWTFRAESHAKLLEWYEDIKKLTNLSGAARDAFVASHQPGAPAESAEADDAALLANDEADEIPYSSSTYSVIPPATTESPKRPEVGRFPSDIQIDRGMAEARRPASSGSDRSFGDRYVVVSANPADPENPRHHSRTSSAFSYDETHPYAQALEHKKEDVVPVGADVPPEVERKLSSRHDYHQNEQALMNRRNSSVRKPPSRKPTASYGVDPVTGQPDPSVFPDANRPIDWSQLIHENEARTRSSHRGPPSRKPTASYGYDPITGVPDQGATMVDQAHQAPLSEHKPSNASIATRDIRVPGDYPKEQ